MAGKATLCSLKFPAHMSQPFMSCSLTTLGNNMCHSGESHNNNQRSYFMFQKIHHTSISAYKPNPFSMSHELCHKHHSKSYKLESTSSKKSIQTPQGSKHHQQQFCRYTLCVENYENAEVQTGLKIISPLCNIQLGWKGRIQVKTETRQQ